jgi:hypothetical protein
MSPAQLSRRDRQLDLKSARQHRYQRTAKCRDRDRAKRLRDLAAGKIPARAAVRRAIERGELTPRPCKYRSNECRGSVQCHHARGYSPVHWLDVDWVCTWHHPLADRRVTRRRAA